MTPNEHSGLWCIDELSDAEGDDELTLGDDHDATRSARIDIRIECFVPPCPKPDECTLKGIGIWYHPCELCTDAEWGWMKS